MNNSPNSLYQIAVLKNLLPSESRSHQARIIEITNIITATSDNIVLVILFGPFARGNFVANSDYNFLILTKDKKYANKNRANKLCKRINDAINNKIKDKTHRFHLTIEPFDYANSLTNTKKYFFADIKIEGILLYDSGESELLRLPGLEINSEDRIKNAKIHYYHLLDKASDFMKYFQFGIDNGNFKGAAFNLHQAAETLFNCTISVFNGYEPRTHDLLELNKLCSANSSQFLNVFLNNTAEEKRSFDLLRKSYIKSRYDKKYEINKNQLEYLADRVRILMEIVINNCDQRINQDLPRIVAISRCD